MRLGVVPVGWWKLGNPGVVFHRSARVPSGSKIVEQPAALDLDAGLLPHLPDQGLGQRLAVLDLAARQAPGTRAVGVLVEQQNLLVLDADTGHTRVGSRRP